MSSYRSETRWVYTYNTIEPTEIKTRTKTKVRDGAGGIEVKLEAFITKAFEQYGHGEGEDAVMTKWGCSEFLQ